MISRYARPATGLRALYRRLDRRIARFRRASGLGCPQGCGECCLSPQVEATVLEMLPVALHLSRRGLLAPTLARLSGEPSPRCLFYSPAPLGGSGGHCSAYPWRPLLCRLFGFGAVTGSGGLPELAVCGVMRAALPGRTRAAAAAVAAGRLRAPLMRDWSLAVYHLDPGLGATALPVNVALRQALERVGLEHGFRGSSRGRSPGGRSPGGAPVRPAA